MHDSTTFRTGAAATRGIICLSGAMDHLPDFERYSRVVTFDEQGARQWSYTEEDDIVSTVSSWTDPATGREALAFMTEDGVVEFRSGDGVVREKIPGAGLWAEDSCGWGYMKDLKRIGDHFYACGGAGQVYRRIAPGQWEHMDEALLQPRDVSERLLPKVIDGLHENAIYLAGSVYSAGLPAAAFFWNGEAWRTLDLPAEAGYINDILIESEERVWMCGNKGALLLGNAVDGFRCVLPRRERLLFLSLCRFEGRIHLGSNLGLFVYDPDEPDADIRKIETGLSPELQDANIVAVRDGVLWSLGPKDIARFDGDRWERFGYPDNPPAGVVVQQPEVAEEAPKSLKPLTTFRFGKAMASDFVCLSGSMDLLHFYEPYTRVILYDEQYEHLWSFDEEEDIVTSIAVWRRPADGYRYFVTLTQNGKVRFMEETDRIEQIPGAGREDDSRYWAYMNAIQQIGGHLYACGDAGQVYKRLGPDRWVRLDEGIRQAHDVAAPLRPFVIEGLHQDAIYLAGCIQSPEYLPVLYFWNGRSWRRFDFPEDAECITGVYIESAQRVWLCGGNGSLFLGNADDGFHRLTPPDPGNLFRSLALFRKKLYLGSDLGLFVYDPGDPGAGVRPVVTGLLPELQDANIVESVDHVLWSIGPKDIARFDGERWQRFHHPDNPRIGDNAGDAVDQGRQAS